MPPMNSVSGVPVALQTDRYTPAFRPATTVNTVDQVNLFWHHNWETGADSYVYVGGADEAASWTIGMLGQAPLNDRSAMFGQVNYYIPGSDSGPFGTSEEIWNVFVRFHCLPWRQIKERYRFRISRVAVIKRRRQRNNGRSVLTWFVRWTMRDSHVGPGDLRRWGLWSDQKLAVTLLVREIRWSTRRTGKTEQYTGDIVYGNVTRPPEAAMVWPVMKLDRSLNRKQANSAISSGRPSRFNGVSCIIWSRVAGANTVAISVWIKPGAMQLIRTCGANASLQQHTVR